MAGRTIATRVSGDPTATNNGLFYIFSDHLGSTSVLATSSGNQVPGSSAGYYPFGSPRTTPTQTITDRNFTGQKENLELGLIYYNARYYVPTIGRFVSADTLIPDPQSPQSFNRYAYTLNNPTRFTDPSGHCTYDSDPNVDDPYANDAQCWNFLWELERIWDIDIQDEELWDYVYLNSLKFIFDHYAEFVGGDKNWFQILKASAQKAGRDKFVIKGDMGTWDDEGNCTTGCSNLGEVRFNLPLSFSLSNPGAGRYGEFYEDDPINQGRLTMAHEFSHILLGIAKESSSIYAGYISARGWEQNARTGSWRDGNGDILLYGSDPSHFFVHVVALYVSTGNTWTQIDPIYWSNSTLTNYEKQWVDHLRLILRGY